ncbi:MAG TPA: hypothetical protein PLX23_02755 [Candidatus Hydrogenedens sp.]|nr:hypothetical protein [Candidatus Hydrogenedens sp.]
MTTFWLLVTIFCIAWYSTMTLYVGVRGFFDIQKMLRALKTSDEIPMNKE